MQLPQALSHNSILLYSEQREITSRKKHNIIKKDKMEFSLCKEKMIKINSQFPQRLIFWVSKAYYLLLVT